MRGINLASNINEISNYIRNIKFKTKFFGGIDEVDVWNKIEILNSEYKELFEKQQMEISILEKRLNEK